MNIFADFFAACILASVICAIIFTRYLLISFKSNYPNTTKETIQADFAEFCEQLYNNL